MAPGTLRTLAALVDPTRRPSEARERLSNIILETHLASPFNLDHAKFLKNLRISRRGAAGGPSGMTANHLFPIFCWLNVQVSWPEGTFRRRFLSGSGWGASRHSRNQTVESEVSLLGTFCVVLARTMAQQVSKNAEKATAPFQHALSTLAGCECVAHAVQALTDLNPEATVVSIDGIGAFDLISRNAMLEGLLQMENGDQVLPFVRNFHGRPSTLWEDEMGTVHEITQGEGGEQGDALMPMLFSLGQHQALVAIQSRLQDDESCLHFWMTFTLCAHLRELKMSTRS